MRYIIAWILIVCCVPSCFACDVCGSSASAFSPGLQAFGNKPAFGIQQQVRRYTTTHPGIFGSFATHSEELFLRSDCRFQLPVSQKWQLAGTLPISYQQQKTTDTTALIVGLSDVQVGFNYFWIDQSDSSRGRAFRLSIGGGIKIPSGKRGNVHDRFFMLYPGTGTWDPFLNASVVLRRLKWIYQFDAVGIARTTNAKFYKPGNFLQIGTVVHYKQFRVWPYSGVQFSWNGNDLVKGELLGASPSRGELFAGIVGFTWPIKKWILSGNTQIPLYQQLSGGMTKQAVAFTCTIHYYLK